MRGLTIFLIAATALAGFAAAAAAQQQAGVSAAVRGQVALARASANIVGRKVESGEKIYLGDAITSGRDSGMQIMLLDETVFSIGPNSEIAIDEFVYDPATDSGKVTASVAKGVFRFITGKIARKRPEDMTVRLPTATIGIRGTIVGGAVRSASGEDPAVDSVFAGLSSMVPDAQRGKEFVILLGPGNENNTNDGGGAFVFTPHRSQRAEHEGGLNAGAPLPPSGPTLFGDGQLISRTGDGIVGYGDGTTSGIFTAPSAPANAVGNLTAAQPPSGPKGSPDDPDARGTTNTPATEAIGISGETIAEAAGDAATQAGLTQVADSSGEVIDPTAGSGQSSFDFNDLRAITTGNASFSGTISGAVSTTFFNVNYGNQQFEFHLNGILSTGAELGCFSPCFVDYSGRSGAAVFTEADADPSVVSNHCVNCTASMVFTDAQTLNVSVEHQGEAGSGTVTLQ